MNNTNINLNNEYITVTIKKEMLELCIRSYKSLGWNVIEEKKHMAVYKIKLSRSKKIKDREKLYKLQREYEEIISKIEKIEIKKTITPTIISVIVGIVATIITFITIKIFIQNMSLQNFVLILMSIALLASPLLIYKKTLERYTKFYENELNQYYDLLV